MIVSVHASAELVKGRLSESWSRAREPRSTGGLYGMSTMASGTPKQSSSSTGSGGGRRPRLPGSGTDTGDQKVLNLTVVWFLGIALLGLAGAIIGYSLVKTGTLPDGLTSLASLIAGGLLGVLNPLSARPRADNNGNGTTAQDTHNPAPVDQEQASTEGDVAATQSAGAEKQPGTT